MGDYCGGTDISILSLCPQEDSDCGVLAVGEPVLQRYCELLQSQWGCSHHRAVRPPRNCSWSLWTLCQGLSSPFCYVFNYHLRAVSPFVSLLGDPLPS